MERPDLSEESEGLGRASSSRAGVAYVELKRRIHQNAFAVDTVVPEQELADLLGTSRSPIREALGRLEIDGLVEVIPGVGMRVLPVSAEDMREIYAILTALETEVAAELAQRGVSQDELATLREATDEMESALQRDDLDTWAEADDRFHRALVAASRNRRLRRITSQFWDQSHRVRMLTLAGRPKPTQSTKDHQDLVDAIEARDPEKAREIHRAHRVRAAETLSTLLAHM